MRIVSLYLAITVLLMSSLSHAYEGYNICNYGEENISSIICSGPTFLKGTNVSGDVKVTGSLQAVKVTLGSLTLTGDADLKEATIKNSAEIVGSLKADGVRIEENLNVTADDIFLNKTIVKGPVTITSSVNQPVLRMECGSKVGGAVTFVGQSGIIKITDDSNVRGEVNNGKYIFVQKSCEE